MGVGGQHWHLLSTLNPNPDKELKWQHWTVQVPWLSLDTIRLLSYSFPELSMDRCVPDTRPSTRDALQGQGLHPTALLRQGSVVEVSRVEVTDGKRGPQGCPPTHTHTA